MGDLGALRGSPRAKTDLAGNYVMVAMMLAMAEETTPPGKEPPFKVGEQ